MVSWLDGTHPSIADGVVKRSLCFSCPTNRCTCSWSNSIKVGNCTSFYVYEIHKEPLFILRYCDNASAGKLIWNKLRH